MRRDDPFGSVVTPGYKVQPAGEAVITGYKNVAAGSDKNPVSTGYKNAAAGDDKNPVSTRYKNAVAGGNKNPVSTGYKNAAAGDDKNLVSTGYKNAVAGGGESAVSTGDKNPVSTGYKNVAEIPVSGGYKTGSAQIAVSGGHKNLFADNGDNASPASAARMDAFTGTAWTAFAATGRDGMVFFGAGRSAFTVAGCFERFASGIRCAGCGYVVMNLFFACRDGFIFSRFVISFLPLKEPLRARGIFLCWRFYEC